jgi:hypothetical protein
MTAPALIKQADLERAIRAARKQGARAVHVSKDGTIMFDISADNSHLVASTATEPGPDGPIKIRKHAKQRMEF